MSNALVRKSLELLGYETAINKGTSKKKKNKSSGVIDLIPTNHRILSKNKKKGSSYVLKRTSKTTVYQVKQQLKSKIDPTEDNVQRLLLLGSNKLDPETTDKIFSRAVKKPYKSKTKEEKLKEEEENRTAFNEEDFKKFEEEYFDS
ncbi:active regulator of SIRT1 [Copidosoma floridanum]|uniref:active regulator of SIRT1 n=1 Tax=Copidosoma floridanum TaxID=29053 RepID=UPI0006C9C990|nr:active regulator of SIRT1 [Copidosoma floridanum]